MTEPPYPTAGPPEGVETLLQHEDTAFIRREESIHLVPVSEEDG